MKQNRALHGVNHNIISNINRVNVERIAYIDIAKAFAIILVVMGHVVSTDTVAKAIIYSFHMPLFFVLSGMTLKYKKQYDVDSWKILLIKKAKCLLLPYFVWGCIYCALTFKNLAFVAYGTRETLIGAGSLSSLWFLPVLYLAFILVEIVLQIAAKFLNHKIVCTSLGYIFLFIAGFLIPHLPKYGDPWGIDIAFIAAAFMIIGMLLRKAIDRFKDRIFLICLFTIFVSVVFLCFVRHSSSTEGYVLMANALYGNPFIFLINAISGSASVILLSYLISAFFRRISWLQRIGQITLGIFVVHKPIVEFGCRMILNFGKSNNYPPFTLMITVITVLVSIVAVCVIERILPEIIGLKRTRTL